MRVALIGNNNNIFFALARYLRDEHWDCDLLLFDDEYYNFSPDADTFSPEQTKTYIRSLTWGSPAGFLSTSKRQIQADLACYDFLIGCGTAPAFVAKAGRTLDVFVPYGEDMYRLPFFPMVNPTRLPAYWASSYSQRCGIRASHATMFSTTNADFERAVQKLTFNGIRKACTPPMIYHPEYAPEILAHHRNNMPLADLVRQVRESSDLVFFQHGRQYWKTTRDKWAMKGNHLLIEGFRDFRQANPLCKAHLILFEYGIDVQHTKNLISQFGLTSAVTWLPTMQRKWIMTAMQDADMVIGELHHSWFTYGVMFEALCLGKPFMHKRSDAFYQHNGAPLYPMIAAASASEVAAGFQQALDAPEDTANIGRGGKAWLLQHGVHEPVSYFSSLLHQAST